jgi:hypothetical protein
VTQGNPSLYRVNKALKALQQAGQIRFFQARSGSRPNITLRTLPTQNIASPATPVQNPGVKPAIMKPGQIICVQCRNPVCQKSKWYCDLHLQLHREAAKRYLDKKRRQGLCLRCDRPTGPVGHVLCEEHRQKHAEAMRRFLHAKTAAARSRKTALENPRKKGHMNL